MRKIPLTKNRYAIVDDADYNLLSSCKWHALQSKDKFMAARHSPRINGVRHTILMHRFLMGLKLGDSRQVDHINHDVLDNRRCNMRICTNRQNAQNKLSYRGCTSQYKGVHRVGNRWRSTIKNNGKMIHIGYYDSETEAALEYNKKASVLFGEFACLNVLARQKGA